MIDSAREQLQVPFASNTRTFIDVENFKHAVLCYESKYVVAIAKVPMGVLRYRLLGRVRIIRIFDFLGTLGLLICVIVYTFKWFLFTIEL